MANSKQREANKINEQQLYAPESALGASAASTKTTDNLIRRYFIIGERQSSHYWWASLVLLGSSGFLLSGILSYFTTQASVNTFNEVSNSLMYIPFLAQSKNIAFFPQGLLLSFYGLLGFILSIYWWFLIFWNVGGGFNEFDKKKGSIRIFRWGYPGKNRRIDLVYPLKQVEAIRVELKQGIDPQRTIYLKIKGKQEIPITGISEPITLKQIEKQASELASFLEVSILT